MLRRFALYGFLKNQRYFEPFIILFFLQRGLSFTEIGFLIAFRELTINLMEVPSGTVADLFGRRRSMMLSFVAYVISFAVFASGRVYPVFFVAMFFFAVGEAFRTGTHKAMIFTWLRTENRLSEKTKVYGYTRSWSKLGSVASTIIAVAIVFVLKDYAWVFWFAIVPYFIGLLNFLGYPAHLEGQPGRVVRACDVAAHLWSCTRNAATVPSLRRLLAESMTYEGVYKAFEDYLQPVVRNTALLLPLFASMAQERRTALLIGVVYVALYLGSAYASRSAHRLVERTGSEDRGSLLLWRLVAVTYFLLVPLLYYELYYLAIAGFVVLALAQNLWRPVLVSRFDEFAGEREGATVLSIESQAKSISTMIVAPLFGLSVDFVRLHGPGGQFWPIALIAALIACAILVLRRHPVTGDPKRTVDECPGR
ncbi:MAG: MFS transporter [Chloroflexota bacterium]